VLLARPGLLGRDGRGLGEPQRSLEIGDRLGDGGGGGTDALWMRDDHAGGRPVLVTLRHGQDTREGTGGERNEHDQPEPSPDRVDPVPDLDRAGRDVVCVEQRHLTISIWGRSRSS
jgi:hypothetical protein